MTHFKLHWAPQGRKAPLIVKKLSTLARLRRLLFPQSIKRQYSLNVLLGRTRLSRPPSRHCPAA